MSGAAGAGGISARNPVVRRIASEAFPNIFPTTYVLYGLMVVSVQEVRKVANTTRSCMSKYDCVESVSHNSKRKMTSIGPILIFPVESI